MRKVLNDGSVMSLELLPGKSCDEIYTHIRTFLLQQNKRCSVGGQCSLRNKKQTNMCAVGCLLSDTDWKKLIAYNPGMNTQNWNTIVYYIDRYVGSDILEPEVNRLITNLQCIHDNNELSTTRKKYLLKVLPESYSDFLARSLGLFKDSK